MRLRFFDRMKIMLTPCRLHIVAEPATLLRVLDRLAVLNLLPNELHFQRTDEKFAVFQLGWNDVEPSRATNLRDRLAQIPAVHIIRFVDPVQQAGLAPDECISMQAN